MPLVLPDNFNQEYDKADDSGRASVGDYDRVEPGTYLAYISKVESKTINDKPTFIPAFKIVSGIGGEVTQQAGKVTPGTPFYLTIKAMWRVAAFLKMLNVTVSDRQVFYPEVLIGRGAVIEVREETYTRPDGTQGTSTKAAEFFPPADQQVNQDARDASDPLWFEAAGADLPF
jgi:hypothetical protein